MTLLANGHWCGNQSAISPINPHTMDYKWAHKGLFEQVNSPL